MTPAEYDIEIIRGATFELPMSMQDGSGPVNFSATYDGARMQVRKSQLHVPDPLNPPVTPILTLTTANGRLVMSGTSLSIHLTAAETAVIPAKGGVYDIELYIGSGPSEIVDKFMHGKFIIAGEVTI